MLKLNYEANTDRTQHEREINSVALRTAFYKSDYHYDYYYYHIIWISDLSEHILSNDADLQR